MAVRSKSVLPSQILAAEIGPEAAAMAQTPGMADLEMQQQQKKQQWKQKQNDSRK